MLASVSYSMYVLFLVQKCTYRCDIQVNQVAKGAISSFDILADLLGSIEHFVDRLNIYTQIPPTPALDKIVVNLIVELITTLAWVTRKLDKRRLREYFFHRGHFTLLNATQSYS
jgi:hypothetical protein